MRLYFVTLVMITFVNLLYGDPLSKNSMKLPHPRYSSVGNPYVPLEVDCALRGFTIEMAAYIAPASMKANWTTLSQSAFQMNQCNNTSHTSYHSLSSAKQFKTAPDMKKGVCVHTVFVHDSKGNDLFDGTFERPLKTIQAALSLTRRLRVVHGS